ncbi:MAG: hypothetical protein IT289_07760 [Oligoflexia bacterium]|nr:hypothetical protein [Oligoflexia bacterium]
MSQRASILLFEENEQTIDLLKDYLTETYDLILAADIRALGEILSRVRPDIILISWDVKRVNPAKLYEQLKASTPWAKIVAYSTDSRPLAIRKFVDARIPDSVFPPISKSGILARLGTLAGIAPLEQKIPDTKNETSQLKIKDQDQSLGDLYRVPTTRDDDGSAIFHEGLSQTIKQFGYQLQNPFKVASSETDVVHVGPLMGGEFSGYVAYGKVHPDDSQLVEALCLGICGKFNGTRGATAKKPSPLTFSIQPCSLPHFFYRLTKYLYGVGAKEPFCISYVPHDDVNTLHIENNELHAKLSPEVALVPGKKAPVDFFVIRPKSSEPVKYLAEGSIITSQSLTRALEYQINEILIKKEDIDTYNKARVASHLGIAIK